MYGHIATLLLCDEFLVRSNAKWNTMTMNKAFCKSTDSSLAEAFFIGKANPISRVNVYFSKNKTLPLP